MNDSVIDIFGSMVFNDTVMKERLPDETYELLRRTMQNGKKLDSNVANIVANAMKDWAIEKGATHYSHWFQPMTGITAEKHDSFISPAADGKIIMEFSGKELIQGEPDASSFPSGGLRATFEARGYTAWDPTSYAFIKDHVLCVPTAFYSYGGEALDMKTPLLRSMEAINNQALRVLKLFGHENVKMIKTTVGPEQEYFLIDKKMYDKRKDLIYTGRTLFGAKPPKGQELDDHYFGTIKPKVASFMKDLDNELWSLGILAKTEHNEAAPAQHELAPIFSTANIATDHNQLTMEIMQKIAKKHGLVCLLHEKPFEGVNGSGKHNNWSLCTDSGINLFEPGETPAENAQFLIFLCAVIKAVDDYQDLLRICVASAGNDHRLGGNEAPPAVVSIFLGEELSAILKAIETDTPYDAKEKEIMKVGVHTLPRFPKDNTDRNRTSPFAFTGNKFEFRMLGSSDTVSSPNVILNTAVAEELKQIADILENAENFKESLHDLIKNIIKNHKRIIFNGNGYDDAWLKKAEQLGLLNLKTTPECWLHYLDSKNIELFTSHKVFSETEMRSRYEINLEKYCKVLKIEALTMIDMIKTDILPAASNYSDKLAQTALRKKELNPDIDCRYETELISMISSDIGNLHALEKEFEILLNKSNKSNDITENSLYYKDVILPTMEKIRLIVDELETVTSSEYWPYPKYGELLFGVC